ncbi:flagellar basal body rod modification protein [Rhodobacteraceae bacterium RKSG542]|uniref:flagellar hook capping FlgD N-terminal domain-containing protein n=1 Tax=Pseudovibrio flavus TaxID=2529854 RepID=UPI0012BBF1E3|nr:flagellar hook capping FlgD N-terminal domain-containing protein [Pseudovibrio flavus]MTI16763.1 flagellar basal body rod modification protein [Pseudovibrio flavus]
MVDAVSGVQPTVQNSQQQPTTSTGSETLDYDAFLMLFMESLKHQDPTEPMSTAEWMGQMAQFSIVEQTTVTNQNLVHMFQQAAVNQAANLIGMELTLADGTKGIIESVQVYTDGSVAKLEDGTVVLLEPGVTISKPGTGDVTDPEVGEPDKPGEGGEQPEKQFFSFNA